MFNPLRQHQKIIDLTDISGLGSFLCKHYVSRPRGIIAALRHKVLGFLGARNLSNHAATGGNFVPSSGQTTLSPSGFKTDLRSGPVTFQTEKKSAVMSALPPKANMCSALANVC